MSAFVLFEIRAGRLAAKSSPLQDDYRRFESYTAHQD